MYHKQNQLFQYPKNSRLGWFAGVATVAALTLAACQVAPTPPTGEDSPAGQQVTEEATSAPVTPSVTVKDQSIESGQVTVSEVTSSGAGWLVIHADAEGKPGPILGYIQVEDGTTSDLVVTIDTSGATETLYAMLHSDAGQVDIFEFPNGPDVPVKIGDQMVSPAFKATGGLASLTPAVSVQDQEIVDNQVTIAEVVSSGPGWLVVHAQVDGKPGPVLGYAPVVDGNNSNVFVEIDSTNATEFLYAMLHTDAGEVGTYEFPDGPDIPVLVNDQMVNPSFTVTGGIAPSATILLSSNQELGEYLTDSAGLSLYTFANDQPGISNCYDQCAINWPPLILLEGQTLAAGEGLSGELGTTERTDGTKNVTYNGLPLYYWIDDKVPGDTTGHGVGNVWAVARPQNPPVYQSGNDTLGKFLVDNKGMTLYTFANDKPGVSNCYDQCAANWPPLTIEEGQALYGAAGVTGELGVIERTDGSTQITYEGLPLYYWVNDVAPGEATGHGVNDVWAVARPAPPTVQLGGNDSLGAFLVDSNGMTLYLFTQDSPNISNCYDQCAVNWPPLILEEGQELNGAAGVTGVLGTIERSDGGLQVTYNGMPLYYWVKDAAPGETTGQGVNGVWFVVPPNSAQGQFGGSGGGYSGGYGGSGDDSGMGSGGSDY